MFSPACRFALCALPALILAGCFALRSTDRDLAAPRPDHEWTALVAEVRAFEQRIGFQQTKNFLRSARDTEGFPFCGYVSRHYLPYSYEDPAIQWLDAATEEECRASGEGADVTFGTSEAVGERETPVTSSMLVAPLHRFLYLVIHEDCHEQFDLPYGIEEALCNVIAFKAMAAFSEERFRSQPLHRYAIQRFVREGAEHAYVTVASYERLAALYARHDRMSPQALMREREKVFRTMERQIAWPRGTMNNVWIANAMTYSRHYTVIERVFEALGRDLARTVMFFKEVDATRPSAGEVTAKHGLKTNSGVDFVRAYEAAVIETIEKALATAGPAAKPKGV